MRLFNRGASIAFSHVFYDTSGDITSPSSARLTINHMTSDGCTRETTYVTLTQNSGTLAWEGTWESLAAYPGPVFWTIHSDDNSVAVQDGQLRLRGNLANVTISTTV